LLFGAPVLAISYFGLWNALPASVPQFWKFVYVLLMYMGVSAGVTSIQVQIGALVPELTDDYDERTGVSGWRLGIANLLGLGAALTHSQIIRLAPRESQEGYQEGYRVSAAVFAVVLCSCAWVTFAGIRERFDTREESRKSMRVLQELRTVLTNKSFLCVSGAYLCGPTAVVLVQSNLLMLCKYWLHDADIIMRIMLCVQGTGLLMVPFWVWVTSRLDKGHAYLIGGSILVVAVGSIYFVTTEAAALGLSCLIGSCLPVPYLIPYSMLPDVIDEDELRTGKRREGIFVGFFTIMLKMSITGALSITNILLKIVGYEAPELGCGHSQDLVDEGQPENVIHFIRCLCSFVPAMFFAVAIALAWLFPSTRKQQATIAKLNAQARLERTSQSCGKLSGNTLHSPRDVQAVAEFISELGNQAEGEHGKVLDAMVYEYTDARSQQYHEQEFTSRISKDVTSDHYSNTSADNESFVEGPINGRPEHRSASDTPQPILPALAPVLKQLCGDKEDTPEGLEFGGSDASTESF